VIWLKMEKPIILASASPRRRELFELLDLPFLVHVVPVDETPRPGEASDVLVARLSAIKAAAVAQDLSAPNLGQVRDTAEATEGGLVVAADTVVVLDDEILGKPRDAAHAKQMLQRLRDRAHIVHSGVTVVEKATGRTAIHLSTTHVWMRDYSETEIDDYVASDDPLDKAGAYAIQHAGFRPAARIEGCFTGVMGLPLGMLADGLAHFGVTMPVDIATVCRGRTGNPCCREAHVP
jgi:septum formation protein